MKLYRDTENGNILTFDELYNEYLSYNLDVSFYQWILNCLDKNGFLEEINERDYYSEKAINERYKKECEFDLLF